MTLSYRELTEAQILRAMSEGKLKGLEGEGKPLPDQVDVAFADMPTQRAFRIMAEAGALPEEVKFRKLRDGARATYRNASSDEERQLAVAVIAQLDLRYTIALEARRTFMAP